MIAARNMSDDDNERMWLLAEERLGYGNMGLYKIDVKSLDIVFYRGRGLGAANSIRVYLRYIKTGETLDEETYHEADRRRFLEMSEKFGLLDDEGGVYDALIGGNAHPISGIVDEVWWPNVIDVETYSALREDAVSYQLIEFEKEVGFPYDGYCEWFRWNNVRARDSCASRIFGLDTNAIARAIEEMGENKWLLGLHSSQRFVTIYVIVVNEVERGILIIRKLKSGTVFRSACIMLHSVKNSTSWSIQECVRIQLRYEAFSWTTFPKDDAYLTAAKRLFRSQSSVRCIYKPGFYSD